MTHRADGPAGRWGASVCGLLGSGLPLCRCSSPATSLQCGFGLCLAGGIIPIAINT